MGRYYFSPPGAVHYPGLHLLGSRNWHDKNWERVQGLGESLTAKHSHLSGEFSGPVPLQRVVGSADCLANGETQPADIADFINGYPPECFIPVAPIPVPVPVPDAMAGYNAGSAFFRCQVQRLWARVIDWLYVDDAASIDAALTEFFGPSVTITIYPVEGDYPAVVTIVHPSWVIAVADGTRNFQQIALQGFASLTGPVNHGAYSTLGLWQQASSHIHDKIVASGVNDTRPVFLVGHSYGAAAMLLLAARYRFWDSGRVVKYLAYGCPKIGDIRARQLLERCDGLALTNDNDAVTSLPPDTLTAAAVSPLFPLLNWSGMNDWERAPNAMVQDDEGRLTPGPPLAMDFATLFAMVTRLVALQPINTILGHGIAEYYRRITLRCPNPGWPVDAEIVDMMNVPDDLPGTIGVAAANGALSGSASIVMGGKNRALTPDGGIVVGGSGALKPASGGILIGGD